MLGESVKDIQFPQIRVLGADVTCGCQEFQRSTVQTDVVKERALAFGKRFAVHGYDGIVHQHIDQVGTQFESGLVAAREKLLVITGGHIARKVD